MKVLLKSFIPGIMFSLMSASAGFCQNLPEALQKNVDEIVREAYEAASVKFPCKMKAGGKPKMIHWESADKCLNDAYSSVDWENVSMRLGDVQEKSGMEPADFLSAVESSMSANALTYDKVFIVKDENVLLPLSNSILKFLPPESLMQLPVTDKAGKRVGNFAGVYTFEKMGEISGIKLRHYLFQYTDADGRMQSSTDRLLLDSFGVPWKDAAIQRGFRLPVDDLSLRRASGDRRALTPKVPRKLN